MRIDHDAKVGSVVITTIDRGLESLLRTSLPLPDDLGDVSFDAPERSWGAQLSRVTVNLFLFDIARSTLPSLPQQDRSAADGRIERRPPMPLVRLSYLVSAWAGSTPEEHQLLGDVLACLTGLSILPAEHLATALACPVQLALPQRELKRPGELWSALDTRIKASFELEVTTVLTAPAWAPASPAVTRVESRVHDRAQDETPSVPASVAADASQMRPPLARRRMGGAVITEGRPDPDRRHEP